MTEKGLLGSLSAAIFLPLNCSYFAFLWLTSQHRPETHWKCLVFDYPSAVPSFHEMMPFSPHSQGTQQPLWSQGLLPILLVPS